MEASSVDARRSALFLSFLETRLQQRRPARCLRGVSTPSATFPRGRLLRAEGRRADDDRREDCHDLSLQLRFIFQRRSFEQTGRSEGEDRHSADSDRPVVSLQPLGRSDCRRRTSRTSTVPKAPCHLSLQRQEVRCSLDLDQRQSVALALSLADSLSIAGERGTHPLRAGGENDFVHRHRSFHHRRRSARSLQTTFILLAESQLTNVRLRYGQARSRCSIDEHR